MDNDAVARQSAWDKLQNAKRAGVRGNNLAVLQADYDAKRATELSNKSQSEQARSILG